MFNILNKIKPLFKFPIYFG